VRISLRAVERVLNSHSNLFKHYETLVANMVNKTDMKNALGLKANVCDVEESMLRLGDALDDKVSIGEMEGIMLDY
jgi:hypothetical protein